MIRKRVEKFETIINLDGPDGNYKNLVMTFDNYFKGSVILETTNEELLS